MLDGIWRFGWPDSCWWDTSETRWVHRQTTSIWKCRLSERWKPGFWSSLSKSKPLLCSLSSECRPSRMQTRIYTEGLSRKQTWRKTCSFSATQATPTNQERKPLCQRIQNRIKTQYSIQFNSNSLQFITLHYQAYTLANPRAMVVESLDAIVANWTVWTPRRSIEHTSIAILDLDCVTVELNFFHSRKPQLRSLSGASFRVPFVAFRLRRVGVPGNYSGISSRS